jgi:hypothetical protein
MDLRRPPLLSYLILFLEGGIYTDTDTSPVRPISEWPGLWNGDIRNFADPVLLVLPTVAALSSRSNAGWSKQGTDKDVLPTGINELTWAESTPPRLIVAIEADLTTHQMKWKDDGLARGIQICQVSCGYR